MSCFSPQLGKWVLQNVRLRFVGRKHILMSSFCDPDRSRQTNCGWCKIYSNNNPPLGAEPSSFLKDTIFGKWYSCRVRCCWFTFGLNIAIQNHWSVSKQNASSLNRLSEWSHQNAKGLCFINALFTCKVLSFLCCFWQCWYKRTFMCNMITANIKGN